MANVPILCYHHIDAAPAEAKFPQLYVDPVEFDRQLALLARFGWRVTSLSSALREVSEESREKVIALTLDDGYVDTLTHALPILERHGCRATCFVVTGAIGTNNAWDRGQYSREMRPLMDRGQLRAWQSAGMEIGSHSVTHSRLDQLDGASVWRELTESRTMLGDLLGVAPNYFCYPFGHFTPEIAELCRTAGYQGAVTTRPGIARPAVARESLPRIVVRGGSSRWQLLREITIPFEDWISRLRGNLHRDTPMFAERER